MDLEEADGSGVLADRREMLGLETDAGGGGKAGHGITLWEWPRGTIPARSVSDQAGRSRICSSSMPMRAVPSACAGSSIVVQVPAGTSVQAFP